MPKNPREKPTSCKMGGYKLEPTQFEVELPSKRVQVVRSVTGYWWVTYDGSVWDGKRWSSEPGYYGWSQIAIVLVDIAAYERRNP